jgi:hypothetical protein
MWPSGNIELLLFLLCGLMIGISKTGLPGFGILVVPLMAILFPAKASTGVLLPMLILADVFAVGYWRRHAVWKHLLRLIPWALVGIVIGCAVMNRLDNRQLGILIGGIVLVLLGLRRVLKKNDAPDADKNRISLGDHPAFFISLGLAAGFTTMTANAAGPIMTIYLLTMRLPKSEFIGTAAWYFLIVNCLKVPFSVYLGLITSDSLQINLLGAPLIVAGSFSGIFLARRIPEKAFGVLVEALAAISALNLIFRFDQIFAAQCA